MIGYARERAQAPSDDPAERLRRLRDHALLATLADTGLRVSEACALTRGQLDWDEGALLLKRTKGHRQDVARISRRAMAALRAYLRARQALDGRSGAKLTALPLFARHDPRAGQATVRPIKPIGVAKALEALIDAAIAAGRLDPDARDAITPHTFRHYFVTAALRGSGGNLKLARGLARHRSLRTTERYAHLSDDELDRGYHEIFNAGAER